MSTPLIRHLHAMEEPTELYDSLSELLRSRPRHTGAYGTLREADRLFSLLDSHLRAGGSLPEPWRREGPVHRV